MVNPVIRGAGAHPAPLRSAADCVSQLGSTMVLIPKDILLSNISLVHIQCPFLGIRYTMIFLVSTVCDRMDYMYFVDCFNNTF